jgi:uncharacterized protein YycO
MKSIRREKEQEDLSVFKEESPFVVKLNLICKLSFEKIINLVKREKGKRKNLLSSRDIFRIYTKVRKGDIILAGDLKKTTNLVIPSALTHATIYIGRRRIIHAIASGVEYSTLHHLVTTYDTVALLRLPPKIRMKRNLIKKAIAYAREQVGKPYESFFKPSTHHFFCTELVNSAYHHAGHKTGLHSIKPFHSLLEKIEKEFLTVEHWLRPEEFLRGKFRVVFLWHNFVFKGNNLFLREKI